MKRTFLHAFALLAALSAWAPITARDAASADDLMEKLRQKTLELQQRRSKPAAPAPKPAPKAAEAPAPKSPPRAAPAKAAVAPDMVVLATGKRDKRDLRALWGGACAERVGVIVRVSGDSIDDVMPGVVPLLGEARRKLVAKCFGVSVIDVVVRPSVGELVVSRAVLQATNQWQVEPVGDATASFPAAQSLAFTSSRGDGRMFVGSDGALLGAYVGGTLLRGRFDGLASPGFDPAVKDRVDRWTVTGHWYEHGSAREKCDQPRRGYAYWGAFEWQVPASETVAGIPGLIRPCGELGDHGKTAEWHLTVVASDAARANPFAVIATSAPDQTAANADALRSGEGWSVRAGATPWCDGVTARLDVIYDAAHDARDPALSGRADGTYDDFVREQLTGLIAEGCPGAATLALRNLRPGEAEPKDVVDYEVIPGTRESDAARTGPPTVRRR